MERLTRHLEMNAVCFALITFRKSFAWNVLKTVRQVFFLIIVLAYEAKCLMDTYEQDVFHFKLFDILVMIPSCFLKLKTAEALVGCHRFSDGTINGTRLGN